MVTTDLLGNADTSFASTVTGTRNRANSAFGVDKTPPGITVTGITDKTTFQAIGGSGPIVGAVTDALSGPEPTQLVAQVSLNPAVTTTGQPASQTIFTNSAPGGAAVGCIIGRYNRTSGAANADTLALTIFNAAGTAVGTCSPTPIPIAALNALSSNAAATSGQVTTRIVAIDQAGNRQAPVTRTIVEDAVNPSAGPLDLPTSLTGGSSPIIPAFVLDNLDVDSSAVVLTYPNQALTLQYPFVAGPGTAFDNSLQPGSTSTSVTATPTITFFARNLEFSSGVLTTPTQAANGPGNIQVGARDESGRVGIATAVVLTTTTQVVQPSSNPWAADFTGGTTITRNNATVSDCPAAGCPGGAAPVNPTSTTFTVTAAGVTSTFANPFTTVQVWYRINGAGSWFLAGTTGAGLSRDTGVGGQRFWDFTLVWTPPKSGPNDVTTGAANVLTGGANIQVIGIGFNATGDGIIAGAGTTLTLTGF